MVMTNLANISFTCLFERSSRIEKNSLTWRKQFCFLFSQINWHHTEYYRNLRFQSRLYKKILKIKITLYYVFPRCIFITKILLRKHKFWIHFLRIWLFTVTWNVIKIKHCLNINFIYIIQVDRLSRLKWFENKYAYFMAFCTLTTIKQYKFISNLEIQQVRFHPRILVDLVR